MDKIKLEKRASECDANRLADQTHTLLFGVRRSIRYHNRRVRFFDRFNKVTTFLAALSGTATFGVALSSASPKLIITFALLVTIFSVVDLVVGTAQSARRHDDLSKKFFELEKAIITAKNITDDTLVQLSTRRLDIEATEPPPLKILDIICHNELMRAMGYDESCFVGLKWYQRLFAQFIDIHEHAVKVPILA